MCVVLGWASCVCSSWGAVCVVLWGVVVCVCCSWEAWCVCVCVLFLGANHCVSSTLAVCNTHHAPQDQQTHDTPPKTIHTRRHYSSQEQHTHHTLLYQHTHTTRTPISRHTPRLSRRTHTPRLPRTHTHTPRSPISTHTTPPENKTHTHTHTPRSTKTNTHIPKMFIFLIVAIVSAARGNHFWYQMSAFPDDDYTAAAEALERRPEGIMSGTGAKKTHTIFIAGVDIKAALMWLGPKRMGKLLCHQATHGWITAALSREMGCMKGHATFETKENKLKFTRATHAIFLVCTWSRCLRMVVVFASLKSHSISSVFHRTLLDPQVSPHFSTPFRLPVLRCKTRR